ncbi:NADH-quinone oxidoreductase subunit N [Rudaeicoccus suwonensis]|uniref:NADH dehydrogenase subunit N n=1 Tax=Rudaeicoccus suwonensis TaxID=657409 RepID=A0A561E7I0_9MICO|nr:proton-conducting transporter membrane subunit [Rudaeicoccus suwonensis]TWE11583.1 NADH dehydrogenase subunit N [Rudaeicoccus suwonensis]
MTISYDWWLLAPVLVPAVGAVLLLVLDAIAPRLGRAHWWLATVLLLAAAATVVMRMPHGDATRQTLCVRGGSCFYALDHVGAGLQLAALVGAAVIALLAGPIRVPAERAAVQAVLLLASAAGAAGVAGARDLGSWLVLLELATIPSIALVALRGRRSATDGSLALLTTALVSFAITVMGAALWFAATGSAMIDSAAVQTAISDPDNRRVLILAIMFIVAGLAFKLSLVPFHTWTPEAFGGASVPIGGFLAVTSKVAALSALLVIFRTVPLIGSSSMVTVAVLAGLSMTVGNVMALRERQTLRFLAWSTVSQAGWVVLPLASTAGSAIRASAGYLLVYVLATIVVFAVVTALAHADGRDEATALASYGGLFRRRPLLALTLSLALLALMGLPPALVGLVAKVLAFEPVVGSSMWPLAIVAAVNAMLGVAVYLRWLRILFGARREPVHAGQVHPVHQVVLLLGLVALAVTSVAPGLLLGLVGH